MTFFYQLLVYLCLVSAPAAVASASAAPEELVLNTQYEFPPYVIPDSQGGLTGHSVAVTRCVAEKLGVRLKVHAYPWLRAQQLVREGIGDGFFPASRNAARDEFAVLSAPVSPQRWYWYLPETDNSDVHSRDFKNNKYVGARLGSNMHFWLKDNDFNLAFYTNDWKTLVIALVNHRVDAILANDETTDPLLRELQGQEQFRKELCLDKPLGVYFSQKFVARYPDFILRFNQQVPGCERKLTDFIE